jgi:diguanylate cyclase (GGDEF)-like protein/PAS domain S-box-containing protein
LIADPAHLTKQETEERYQLLVNCIEDMAIYMLDISGRVVTWNRGAEIHKGFRNDEIVGRHFRTFFAPEDIAAGVPERELEEALREGRCAGEGWRLRKNGSRFWSSYVLTAMRDRSGKLVGFAKVTRDSTEDKQTQDALRAMEARLREERDRLHAVAESSMDALFVCDAVRNEEGEVEDFIFTYLNSNVEKLVAVSRNTLLGRRMSEVIPSNRAGGFFDLYKQVVNTGEPLIKEFPVPGMELSSTWVRIQAVKLHDGVAISASDITERKQFEMRILHMAQHDALTGLPNRTLLQDRVANGLKQAHRKGTKTALLLVDLDGFKQINDTLGHSAGDTVLQIVGRRLQAAVRDTDSAIRTGGDEFVIVAPDISAAGMALDLARRVVSQVGQPIPIADTAVCVTTSIGIALYPDHAERVEDLLYRADSAMYTAKRLGKNRAHLAAARETLDSPS